MKWFFGLLIVAGIIWWNFKGKQSVRDRVQAREEMKAEGFDFSSEEAKASYAERVAEVSKESQAKKKQANKDFFLNVAKHIADKK